MRMANKCRDLKGSGCASFNVKERLALQPTVNLDPLAEV